MKHHSLTNLFKKVIVTGFLTVSLVFMFTGCPDPNNAGGGNSGGGKNTTSKGTLEINYDTSTFSFHQTRIGDTYKIRISFPDWSPIPQKVDIWYEGLDQAWKKDVPVVNDGGSFYVTFEISDIAPYKKYNIWAQIDDIKSNKLEEIKVLQKEQSITAELVSSYEKALKFNFTFENYTDAEIPTKLGCTSGWHEGSTWNKKEVSVINKSVTVDLSEYDYFLDTYGVGLIDVQFYEITDENDINAWVYSNTIENIIIKPKVYLYIEANAENPYNTEMYNYPGKKQKFFVEFYDFETTPDTVDVYCKDELYEEDVQIVNGAFELTMKSDMYSTNKGASYSFTVKTGEETSNKVILKLKNAITFAKVNSYNYIGDDFVFGVDCGGLEEVPAKLDVQIKQNGVERVLGGNLNFVDSKITCPISYDDGFKAGAITVIITYDGKEIKDTNTYRLSDKMEIQCNSSVASYRRGNKAEYTIWFEGDWSEFPETVTVYKDDGTFLATGTVTMIDNETGKGTLTFNINTAFTTGSYEIYTATQDEKYRSGLKPIEIN